MASGHYVFFDVDDTLVEWTVSWGHAFARAARGVGVGASPEEASAALTTAFDGAYSGYVRKHARRGDEKVFWREYDGHVLRLLGVEERLLEAAEKVIAVLTQPAAIRLYPEARETLEQLRRAGVRLGVVTGRPRAAPDLSRLGVVHYFDPVIDAFAAESAKSDGRMFEMASAAAAEAGRTAWHVGDSYEDDVRGARAAGLRPVLLDRRGERAGDDCTRIRTLRELPELIWSTTPEMAL